MFISNAVSSQLFVVVKRGICAAEPSILQALETLLCGAKGPGQRNSLALWACMWSLILTYRDCVATYKLYSTNCSSRTRLRMLDLCLPTLSHKLLLTALRLSTPHRCLTAHARCFDSSICGFIQAVHSLVSRLADRSKLQTTREK